jgi:hypothetical protein
MALICGFSSNIKVVFVLCTSQGCTLLGGALLLAQKTCCLKYIISPANPSVVI